MVQYKLKPQPGDKRNVSQGDILNNFTYLQTSVGNDHFFSTDTATTNDGLHKQSTYFVSPDPTTSATQVATYSKNDAAGVPQLWFRSISNGTPVQLTATPLAGTVPVRATKGVTYLPGNMLLQWGTDTQNTGGLTTFQVAFSANAYSVVLTPTIATGTANGFLNVLVKNANNFQIGNTTGVAQSYTYNWIAIGPA